MPRARTRQTVRRSSVPRQPPKFSARLEAFSDREFLSLVVENADVDGWADTRELAGIIFPAAMNNGHSRNAISAVSVRLGWMRRFGVVSKKPKAELRWGLTPTGHSFVLGSLNNKLTDSLSELSDDKLLELQHQINLRYRRADPLAQHMIRREFRYGTSKLRVAAG